MFHLPLYSPRIRLTQIGLNRVIGGNVGLKPLNKNTALILMVALAASSGMALGAVLVHRTLTGSVTIQAYGDIGLLDGDTGLLGELINLDFGILTPGEHSNKKIAIKNQGNSPIDLTITSNIGNVPNIMCTFMNTDGTPFSPSTPKRIAVGDMIYVVIEIWSTADAYGDYTLEFSFIGEG